MFLQNSIKEILLIQLDKYEKTPRCFAGSYKRMCAVRVIFTGCATSLESKVCCPCFNPRLRVFTRHPFHGIEVHLSGTVLFHLCFCSSGRCTGLDHGILGGEGTRYDIRSFASLVQNIPRLMAVCDASVPHHYHLLSP